MKEKTKRHRKNNINNDQKYHLPLYYKLALIIGSLLVVATLVSSWLIWNFLKYNETNAYLSWLNDHAPENSQLIITFMCLTIVTFIVVGAIALLTLIPFIFINHVAKGIFFAFLTFISTTIIVLWFCFYAIIWRGPLLTLLHKEADIASNTTGNLLMFFLPWLLTAIWTLFLWVNSILLLNNLVRHYHLKPVNNDNTMSEANKEKKVAIANLHTATLKSDINHGEPKHVLHHEQPAKIVHHQSHHTKSPLIYETKTHQSHSHGASVVATKKVAAHGHGGALEEETVKKVKPTHHTTHAVHPTHKEHKEHHAAATHPTPQAVSTHPHNPHEIVDTGETIVAVSISSDNNENNNHADFEITTNSDVIISIDEPPTVAPATKEEKVPLAPVITDSVDGDKKTPAKTTPKTKPLWTKEQIAAVWEKAEIIDGVSAKLYRKDYSGAWMFHDAFTNDLHHDNNEKTYAWTIVLHRPLSKGGTKDVYNLDPMNIINARAKGNDYPRWTTKLSSKGNENIFKTQTWKARS